MRILDSTVTRDALPFAELIDALREMFIEGCHVPLRHNHKIATESDEGTLLIMPAWQEGRHLGIKTVNVFPGNAALGLPGQHSTYVLYDARTGAPHGCGLCSRGELSRAQGRHAHDAARRRPRGQSRAGSVSRRATDSRSRCMGCGTRGVGATRRV